MQSSPQQQVWPFVIKKLEIYALIQSTLGVITSLAKFPYFIWKAKLPMCLFLNNFIHKTNNITTLTMWTNGGSNISST